MYPGGACLSENQWTVWWGPLSVVMKLRGHPSTQMTHLTWLRLTRPWQRRQPEQWEQSQSNWGATHTPKQLSHWLYFFFLPVAFHYIYFLQITNQHSVEEMYWNIKKLNLCTVPGTDCSLKLQQREFLECRHCCCEHVRMAENRPRSGNTPRLHDG